MTLSVYTKYIMQIKTKRSILREDVRKWVLDAICRGTLAPETALGEVELAKQLNISRTPLREALVALERDGLVESKPGKGFVVAPLVVSEMAELYPLIGNLEAFAMRSVTSFSSKKIEKLRQLNEKLGGAKSVARALTLDEKWHSLLLCSSNNRKVLELIERQKTQVRRLEFAFTRIFDNVEASMRDHSAVLDYLESGGIEMAAQRLEEHWKG